jgi:hypothetical protein
MGRPVGSRVVRPWGDPMRCGVVRPWQWARVFCPDVGARLHGRVNKVGVDFIGLLVGPRHAPRATRRAPRRVLAPPVMPCRCTQHPPGFKVRWMAWRTTSLADVARDVIVCHVTQETRIQRACR